MKGAHQSEGTSAERKKICVITASEITVTAFLIDQIRALGTRYDLYVAVNTSNLHFLTPFGISATVIPVAIERKIRLWSDCKALIALCRLFRRQHFDLIHSVSPKAGLLAMIAGALCAIPRRLHTFTGQVWATRKGAMRHMLKLFDKILAATATHVLIDSCSQRDFLVAHGVVSAEKSTVLAHGSISGVDTVRFQPDAAMRAQVRSELGIPEQAIVFLYLGRLNVDKGILDLAGAFAQLCRIRDNVWLALIGPDEDNMLANVRALSGSERLASVGYTAKPERYMAAADVFCLPSYREGFGTVIIEAAACGVPAIATRIYGITDAVQEEVTGLLYPPGDRVALEMLMARLSTDHELRRKLGVGARQRALNDFEQATVTQALLKFYAKIL